MKRILLVLSLTLLIVFPVYAGADGHISTLSKEITRKSIHYKNRYGMNIAGELYISKKLDLKEKHPAIIVGAPYGGVKEQAPSVYADNLAKYGFIVLTFDQSFIGDSEGKPRHVSSPDIFVENFSAAVDYLGLQDFVDREKIGIIGICGSGGFALSAAQVDTRIKAVATSSMYDMSAAVREGLDKEQLATLKDKISRQRWTDAQAKKPEYIPMFPEKPLEIIPEMDEISDEWFRFYATKRGFHKEARGGATTTSTLALMNFKLLDYIEEISPRPILFIVGDRAHSKYFSENAYAKAKEPKEIFVVKDAEHIDLYDRVDRIPFAKIVEFFNDNLK